MFTCIHCTRLLGYYCLKNTTEPTQYRCPPGTFNPKKIQANVSSCLLCRPGMYCEGYANYEPTDNCSAGWFCSGGASTSQPSGGNCCLCICVCNVIACAWTGKSRISKFTRIFKLLSYTKLSVGVRSLYIYALYVNMTTA